MKTNPPPGSNSSPNSSQEPKPQAVQGEGDYNAARRYNKASKTFAQSGAVPAAAADAEPRSEQEAQELAAAEREGRQHAKGEDPQIKRP